MPTHPSCFAPAERSAKKDLYDDYHTILNNGHIASLLDAMPQFTAMLNFHRQIVYSNKALLQFIGPADLESIIGQRPGEMLDCQNAHNQTGGCGTSASCEFCGATGAILQSQLAKKITRKECRISASKNNLPVAYDLFVTASPMQLNGSQFTLLSIEDISDTKRRLAIEKIFFHDVLNTAGGIKGYIEFLKILNLPEETVRHLDRLDKISDDLIEEILTQRDLTAAESGELIVDLKKIDARSFIADIAEFARHHPVASGKVVLVDNKDLDSLLKSDPILLKRVMMNMVKNALEASGEGTTVTTGAFKNINKTVFYVHNQQFIPHAAQLQLFQRSFSTKAANRGLGTYSMKLITEKYLNGKIWFESSQEKGTTFFVEIP